MSAEPISILTTTDGEPVPLKSVTARGRLDGLVFELTVEQRYHNTSVDNLEAVFTFPLPLRAVLLGFELEIGERRLSAVAVARAEASEQYEQAIDAGNTAALIEKNDEGLYTVSLGNLLAGETAVIRYRYAELLDAHAGYVRLNVPTVIAPRYGDPGDAGLEGPTVPGVDLLGEYPFEITLDLVGLTDAASLRSPSHRITTTTGDDGLTVTLARKGFLDRDFVLELAAAAVPAAALVARDGDGYVLLASPVLAPDTAEQRPLALKLLLDCSGSMAGASIDAARTALLSILDRLGPTDHVSLTRFGSRVEHVSEGLEPADPHTLTPLKALVRRIEADLGGTEMQGAIKATLAIRVPKRSQADVILITDGEIYDLTGVLGAAARSGQRVFAIAIGAAPNEALARKLSAETGGACEFVSDAADAEAAILRTFKRLRSTPRTLGIVDWPATSIWTAPLPTAVFPGDTLHLFAGFAAAPTGETRLTICDAAGHGTALAVPAHTRLSSGDLLPRLAAARRLGALSDEAAKALAVQYQLATEFTSFVVVAERAEGEKAERLPATVAVPHMLAAAWGGSATTLGVVCSRSESPRVVAGPAHEITPAFGRIPSPPAVPCPASDAEWSASAHSADFAPRLQAFEPASQPPSATFGVDDRARLLHSIAERFVQRGEKPRSIDELVAHGLSRELQEVLRFMVSHGEASEQDLVAAVLALLGSEWSSPEVVDWLQHRIVSELAGTVRPFSQIAPDPTQQFARTSEAYGREVAEEVLRQLRGDVLSRREFRPIRQLLRERVLT